MLFICAGGLHIQLIVVGNGKYYLSSFLYFSYMKLYIEFEKFRITFQQNKGERYLFFEK